MINSVSVNLKEFEAMIIAILDKGKTN